MKPRHFWNVKQTGLGESVKGHFYSYWTYSRNVKYNELKKETKQNERRSTENHDQNH